MKSTVLLDFHGIIYFHDDSLIVDKSDGKWDAKVSEYVLKGDNRDELDIEYDLVKNEVLNIFYPKGAKEKLMQLLDEYKVVTCSTSRIELQKLILREYLGYDFDLSVIEFNDFSDFGSKKDPEAWKKLLSNYPDTDLIYEDKEKNILAIKEAVTQLNLKDLQIKKNLI